MTLSYKVWDFPKIAVRGQVFRVPGQAVEGGYTSGGARIISPEPGGRGVLEIDLSLQVKEWAAPYFSWLMSKTNGQIFKVLLTKTPQLALANLGSVTANNVPWADTGFMPKSTWDNNKNWAADGFGLEPVSAALAGSVNLQVNMAGYGEILKPGHVVGHMSSTYLIDDIEYVGNVASLTITPPLRKDVTFTDTIFLQPYFTGTIVNGEEFKASYDAENIGHIQPGRLVLRETIL